MLVFGTVSSMFDLLTFAVLLLVLRAGPIEFRTGWFVESVVSAALIVLVVRTRRNPFSSRPSRPLLAATLLVSAATIALPFTPLAGLFGFATIPPVFIVFLSGIVLLYMATAVIAVKWFYKSIGFNT
jgi:Mg2+-importing ATPase